MTGRHYAVYDVFTSAPLAGNQLAVVFDTDGLGTAQMQAIAREFNLSETVFILPPDDPSHEARVRIFVPSRELPFAGHPTVGSAVAIAELRYGKGRRDFVLEEIVGDICCTTVVAEGPSWAEFDLPRLPERIELPLDKEMLADALHIAPEEIGFDGHQLAAFTAGVPYVTVPVKSIEVVEHCAVISEKWLAYAKFPGAIPAAPYIYCRGGRHDHSSFHTRMFAPWDGIAEDPATGSAAAAFAGALMAFETPKVYYSHYRLEQGVEMERPSFIDLALAVEAGKLVSVSVSGNVVKIAEGRLFA
jgi:trans-2,3-dihydro-3-hydroxyanthranilate isomerase